MRWFLRHQRDLPWRRTRDPYAIWLSEIMLQQTRVAAVIPYYDRFLVKYPRVEDLASAPEPELLAMWAGLGYYSRARNMQKAAQQVVELGGFPREHGAVRALAGIGDYTAAAITSIAFGLPHAAVDGNVRRVVTRLSGDPSTNVQVEVDALLDRRDPGAWNQALMELGALICVPRNPLCEECPARQWCGAAQHSLQHELPARKPKAKLVRKDRTLLVMRRDGDVLLVPSPRVNGFWDLPEPFEGAQLGATLGEFRHAITVSQYRFEVREARLTRKEVPDGARWWPEKNLYQIPLGTASKKALACLQKVEGT
jgi:A/G-specific adenine glycosylase